MSNRVASFTPLPVRWPHPAGKLTGHISIVKKPMFDEQEWKTIFNMRHSEETAVRESPYWMCAEAECSSYDNRHSLLQETASDVRIAMLGFQIWMPKGWTAVIVNSELKESGAEEVVSVSYPECYWLSKWANLLSIDSQPFVELGSIIDGTLAALEADSISTKNPFQYLEIGLQTAVNHRKAGALMWMIGLDSLLAAQRADTFKARLCRLLGANSYIFPQDFLGRQPTYKVGELAADIYQLRNQIAHGDRVRSEYLKKSGFSVEPTLLDFFKIDECSYQTVLCEASLFLLCAALRQVILDGHLDLLAQPKEWKRWIGKA